MGKVVSPHGYKFVILEVSNKIGRDCWRNPAVALRDMDWDRPPDRFGIDPSRHAEAAALAAAIRRAVDTTPTRAAAAAVCRHRARRGAARRARRQTRREPQRDLQVFDARRKIRAYLVANEYLPDDIALGKQ